MTTVYKARYLSWDDNDDRITEISADIVDDERTMFLLANSEIEAQEWLHRNENIRNISRLKPIDDSEIPDGTKIQKVPKQPEA